MLFVWVGCWRCWRYVRGHVNRIVRGGIIFFVNTALDVIWKVVIDVFLGMDVVS